MYETYKMQCYNCKFETTLQSEITLREYADAHFEYTKRKIKVKVDKDYWVHEEEWVCPICGSNLCWVRHRSKNIISF